jgi:hypothetical protein
MNIAKYSRLAAFAVVASLAALAWAQSVRGGRLYNPSTESTIQGSVTQVSTVTGKHGWNGLHLALRHDGEISDVHLGPAQWISSRGFSFAEGDQVEIVASHVKYQGTDAWVARQITKDGKVLVLRDEQGFPQWSRSGWRRQ